MAIGGVYRGKARTRRKDAGPDTKFGKKGEKDVGVMRRGRAMLADAAFKNQNGPTDLLRRGTRAAKRAMGIKQSGQGASTKSTTGNNPRGGSSTSASRPAKSEPMRSPRDPSKAQERSQKFPLSPAKLNSQISSGRTGTAPAAATSASPKDNKTGGSTGATSPRPQGRVGTGTFVEGRPPILTTVTNKADAAAGSRKMPSMSNSGKNSGPGKGTVPGMKTGAQSTAPSVGKTMNTPAMGGRMGGGGGSRSATTSTTPMRDTSSAARGATQAARATVMSGKSSTPAAPAAAAEKKGFFGSLFSAKKDPSTRAEYDRQGFYKNK